MHPHLSEAVAQARADDLHRAARGHRIAAAAGARRLRFRARLLDALRPAPNGAAGAMDITSVAVS